MHNLAIASPWQGGHATYIVFVFHTLMCMLCMLQVWLQGTAAATTFSLSDCHTYLGIRTSFAIDSSTFLSNVLQVRLRGTAAATNFALSDYRADLAEYHKMQQVRFVSLVSLIQQCSFQLTKSQSSVLKTKQITTESVTLNCNCECDGLMATRVLNINGFCHKECQ